MSATPRGLDHLVIAVPDLDAAVARYRAFGFTTTPRAMHPWGTANSLVQFQRNFLELLSVERAGDFPSAAAGEFGFGDFNRRFLQRHSGLSMVVFSSTDAAADLAHWRDRGLTTYAPFHFSRDATLPDGATVTVAFSLGFVTHPEMPWAAWFVCQQHHPENFWKPRYQRHDNGARRLRSVIMAASEPRRYRGFLRDLFPESEVVDEDGGVRMQLPEGAVHLLQPGQLEERIAHPVGSPCSDGPRFVAAVVEVADLDALGRTLSANAIPARRVGDELWVAPGANEGLSLGFCASG